MCVETQRPLEHPLLRDRKLPISGARRNQVGELAKLTLRHHSFTFRPRQAAPLATTESCRVSTAGFTAAAQEARFDLKHLRPDAGEPGRRASRKPAQLRRLVQQRALRPLWMRRRVRRAKR